MAFDSVGWQNSGSAAKLKSGSFEAAGAALCWQMSQEHTNSDRDANSARWAALMVAAQGGDRQAYSQILKEIAVFADALVRRFHSNPSTIEDVVQDTLLTIHRVRHTYEPGRSVHAWVAAIVRRRAIDTLRSQRRRDVSSVPYEEHDIADERANHAEAFAHRAEIADALDSLPSAQREAIRLLKVEELSLDEASRVSGRSVLSLKSLVHRAVRTLRAKIAGELDD